MRKLLVSCCAVLPLALVPAVAQASEYAAHGFSQDTLPLDVWTLTGVVTSVQISPSGEKLLVMKRFAKDGEIIGEIYDMSDLTGKPHRFDAGSMDILNAQWINDEIIFGTAYQQTRKSVPRQEAEVWDYATFSYNIDKKKFSTLSTTDFSRGGGNIQVVGTLPAEPDNVIISTAKSSQGVGDSRSNLFRPANFYNLNLRSGAKSLLYRGTTDRPSVTFDPNGNIISSVRSENDKITFEVRAPGDTDWKTVQGVVIDMDKIEDVHHVYGSAYPLGVQASGDDPNKGIMFWRKDGNDKAGVYEVDLRTGEVGREIFKPTTADAMGVMRNSNARAGDFRIAAITYPGAKYERHWIDQKEKALYDKISAQIPNAHTVNISSRSRDGQKMVIVNRGPKDPGSYWLLDGNQLTPLGSRNPLLTADKLNDTEYHIIKARDGRDIPTYITKPKGEGPFPTIVMPHGGPHVNEVVDYDAWTQLLAGHGYMVIQPQYRTSTGLGKAHFEAGYDEHGGAMQDDKDDTALWAVEQGWADPDRMAMYGFSYGGYAAAVAASRDEQLYQCTVAGAAVLNAMRQVKGFENPWMAEGAKQWGRWRGADSGVDPIKDIEKVNIPMFVISGKVDSRVMPYNHTDYEKAVKKSSKRDMIKFLQVKDMDHGGLGMQFNYDNNYLYWDEVLSYLKNDCGPGGL